MAYILHEPLSWWHLFWQCLFDLDHRSQIRTERWPMPQHYRGSSQLLLPFYLKFSNDKLRSFMTIFNVIHISSFGISGSNDKVPWPFSQTSGQLDWRDLLLWGQTFEGKKFLDVCVSYKECVLLKKLIPLVMPEFADLQNSPRTESGDVASGCRWKDQRRHNQCWTDSKNVFSTVHVHA